MPPEGCKKQCDSWQSLSRVYINILCQIEKPVIGIVKPIEKLRFLKWSEIEEHTHTNLIWGAQTIYDAHCFLTTSVSLLLVLKIKQYSTTLGGFLWNNLFPQSQMWRVNINGHRCPVSWQLRRVVIYCPLGCLYDLSGFLHPPSENNGSNNMLA